MTFQRIAAWCTLVAAAIVSLSVPAAAQSREQRQLMADVRMLQEQTQLLQNLLAETINAIKDVNARIDEQGRLTGKALADQKLVIDNITNNIREVREKLDDNTVRLGSLGDEVDAIRMGLQQLSTLPGLTAPVPLGEQPGTPAASAGVDPSAAPPPAALPAAAPPAAPIGASPQRLWDEAQSDYALGQWDLAIAGYQALITYFPKAERAADAQVRIGLSHVMAGNNERAVEAFDTAIQTYPGSAALPEAYYRKGLALKELKRQDEARAAFEHVVKTYPDSTAALLARQQLVPSKP